MKVLKVLKALAKVRKVVAMDAADFGTLGDDDAPVTMRNGDPVTEGNVTEFIMERTARWRESWILIPLDEAIKLVEDGKRERER